MKILVYGGNQFGVRARIGDWPEIPEGCLNDHYGIPTGRPSFGLVFLDKNPCLLYRERINPEVRNGYPYTVLIDPGPWQPEISIWRRCNWNAAALLHGLFGVQSRWRESFLNPSELSTGVVQSALDDLLRDGQKELIAEGSGYSEAASNWASLLTGALGTPGLALATPASLGLAGRPSMNEVAGWVGQMPLFSRMSGGWMVGGSSTQAAGFGAGVLLDDEPYGANANPFEILRKGSAMLAALNEMTGWQPTAERVLSLMNRPAFDWEDLPEFFEQAQVWEAVHSAADAACPTELPASGPLTAEILLATLDFAEEKAALGEPIGPNRSSALLLSRSRLSRPIGREITALLDPETLCRQLDVEEAPPTPLVLLELPPELCLKRCLAWLGGKPSPEPADLEKCRVFLRKSGAESEDEQLLMDFVGRLSVLEPPKGADARLIDCLKAEARKRLQRGLVSGMPSSWLADGFVLLPFAEVQPYLRLEEQDVDEVVRELIAFQPLSKAACGWLDSLAASEEKSNLSTDVKLELSKLKLTKWSEFYRLSQAMEGFAPFQPVSMTAKHLRELAEECMELLEYCLLNGSLRIGEPEFRKLAATLRLQDLYAPKLRDLAFSNPAFQQLHLSILPAQPDNPQYSASRAAGNEAVADPLAEALRMRAVIGALQSRASLFPNVFETSGCRDNPAAYDHLVDLEWFEGFPRTLAKIKNGESYGEPASRMSLIVLTVVLYAAAVIAILLQRVRILGWFHNLPNAAYWGIPLIALILFLPLMFFAAFVWRRPVPRYSLNFSFGQYNRLNDLIDALFCQRNGYAIDRARNLTKRLLGNKSPLTDENSFDRALLLYLGRGNSQLSQLMEDKPERTVKRVRCSIYKVLMARKLIRRKGWFY
jgi:hypothetical protein